MNESQDAAEFAAQIDAAAAERTLAYLDAKHDDTATHAAETLARLDRRAS